MIVISAGAEVRAREPHVGEAGAVGAAADGDLFRGQAGLLDGLAGRLYKVEVGLDLLQHIAVAVLDLDFHRAGAILAVEVAGDVEEVVLLELQLADVVVAEDIAQLGLGDVAVHLAQMVEALIALGGLGAGHDGQGHVEFHCHVGGVDHRVLRGAGVDREAVDRDGGAGGGTAGQPGAAPGRCGHAAVPDDLCDGDERRLPAAQFGDRAHQRHCHAVQRHAADLSLYGGGQGHGCGDLRRGGI